MTGTASAPLPADTSKTEPKVKVGTIVTYLAGLVLFAVLTGVQQGNLVDFLPDWASSVLAPLIPAALSFLAAYNTRHQFRAPTAVVGQ